MITKKPLLSILCIDDHAIVRLGIRALIRSQTDMTVIADAASGEEGVRLFRELRPDITLMDLQLPGMSGIEAIQLIRQENGSARVIVLTMYQGSEDIHRAHEAGAVSYLLKETLSDDLVSTIRAVHEGRQPLHEQIKARLSQVDSQHRLSAREVQIMELIALGMSSKEVAASLDIGVETAHTHLKHIFLKLNVTDRTSAVSAALRRGIIHLK